jgi:hypothetical protein
VTLVKRIRNSLSFRWRGFLRSLLNMQTARVRHQALPLLRSVKLRTSDDFPFTIATLVGKKQLPDLLLTLASYERAVGTIGNLTVLSDGSLDRQDADFLSSWCDRCQVFLDFDSFCEFHNYKPHPTLLKFYKAHFLAPKVIILDAVAAIANCLLLDSDVVFFQNPLATLLQCVKSQTCACFEDEIESFDRKVIDYAQANGVTVSGKVNTGLVYVPKGKLQGLDWSKIISTDSLSVPHVFTEQTAIAVALETVGYRFFPRDKFVVALRGAAFPYGDYAPFHDIDQPYESLVCRHFVTPIRYLMWLNALPKLKDKFLADNLTN